MISNENGMSLEQAPDPDAVDVVIDLGQVPEQRRALLIETLLAAEEGMPCRYRIRLGGQRPSYALLAHLLELLARRQGELLTELPGIEFPQLLVDEELTEAVSDDVRRRTVAKMAWYKANLSILHAIEQYDEFVFLTPASLPVRHGWLAALTRAGRRGDAPVCSEHRKLLVTGRYHSCGWAMSGWFNGRLLRQLPLRTAFRDRIANPWMPLGDFQRQRGGPGFCLAGDWLSGFDVPMDYLLFAMHYSNALGDDDPMHWAAECGEHGALVMSEVPDTPLSGARFTPAGDTVLVLSRCADRYLQYATLRELYRDAARRRYRINDSILSEKSLQLPQSGPRWNLLGRNQIPFAMEDLAGLFKGERCFIIGNGPSLKHTDLSLLKNEYTIGLNRLYLNYPSMGFQPSLLCVTNPNIVEQFHQEIDVLNSVKFLTYRTRELIRNRWNTFFMVSQGAHEFFEDLSDYFWCEGCTVTYCAMQVAFYLGFDTVVLVGVDHRFPDSGTPHKLVTADGPDQNHFHPDYFGKGVKWQYPDLPASEVSYRVAKAIYERHGRRILDATVNGNLRIFPRVDYGVCLETVL